MRATHMQTWGWELEGKGGCFHFTIGKWRGEEGVKSKKQFLGRKEVRLALGHQCVHDQVCSGRKVVTPTIVRKWDCRRGPPGASQAA